MSLAAFVAACGFRLPTPPDLEPLQQEYENPTAVFDESLAEEFIDTYSRQRERLASVSNLRDVRQVVTDFDEGVSASSGDGDEVRLGGVPLRTNALITLEGRCSASEQTKLDDIVARVVVRDSRVTPVIWGDIEDCATRPEQGPLARIWGKAEVYIPTLLTEQTPIYLIAYDLSRVRVAGLDEAGWSGDLRYVGERLELLVRSPGGATAVLFGGPVPRVGVRAKNGEWECSVEERVCESSTEQDSSFSF